MRGGAREMFRLPMWVGGGPLPSLRAAVLQFTSELLKLIFRWRDVQVDTNSAQWVGGLQGSPWLTWPCLPRTVSIPVCCYLLVPS